jgi:hypothetical protein
MPCMQAHPKRVNPPTRCSVVVASLQKASSKSHQSASRSVCIGCVSQPDKWAGHISSSIYPDLQCAIRSLLMPLPAFAGLHLAPTHALHVATARSVIAGPAMVLEGPLISTNLASPTEAEATASPTDAETAAPRFTPQSLPALERGTSHRPAPGHHTSSSTINDFAPAPACLLATHS